MSSLITALMRAAINEKKNKQKKAKTKVSRQKLNI